MHANISYMYTLHSYDEVIYKDLKRTELTTMPPIRFNGALMFNKNDVANKHDNRHRNKPPSDTQGAIDEG